MISERKDKLKQLIEKYQSFKEQGRLDLSSEETIRTWINKLLTIFDWDAMDTSQVLQEKVLSKEEKAKLKEIGSTSTRPDYTFKFGNEKLTFLDAKATNVNLKTDESAAFQIKSYGWSILAPCAFITNFEEFAIYDCTYIPFQGQNANLGRLYFTINDYLDNFDILENHLLRKNILKGTLSKIYSDTLKSEKHIQKLTPDLAFAKELSVFRLSLARNIYENNNEIIDNNSELLAYMVQVIINRIIFIRICEARKIEREGLLLEYQEKDFWDEFKESSYNDFYKHYDGPLFERINSLQKITVSNEVLKELVDLLYYPSPYRFDVIPTKLLSDIYEIFLSKKLFIEESIVSEKLKLEYIKTNGAVSTPQYLVHDLLKRTMPKSKLIENGLAGIFDTKILDFACGSGVFLIEVFDFFQNLLVEFFTEHPHKDFEQFFFAEGRNTTLTIEGKRHLISKCIYGVDIDPEAVEVARMSLSLKVIDSSDFLENYQALGIFGNQILNNIGNNIKCGNTLVSSDISKDYPDIKNNSEQLFRTNPFNWNSISGFADIFEGKNGFDFIVGNPPYVEVKNYNVEYPYMHQYIKDKYQTTTNGKIDLSVAFIERGISLLNNQGKLGLIIQKRFFKTEYGKKIRDYISSNKLLHQVIDFESTGLFKSRITYIATLILDKSNPENVSFIKIESDPDELPIKLREIPTVEIDSSSFTIIPSKAFNSNPWNFEDAELLKIKTELLLRHGKFGDFAKVRVGIQVLWDKAYHLKIRKVNDDGTIFCDSHLENNFLIEINACRPLLVNERFYPFCPGSTNTHVIFPYDVSLNENTPIGFTEFCERFPLAGDYLIRHKAEIVANVETCDDDESWHHFTRVQNHKAIYPKVLIPMTAQDTFASVSQNPLNYCDNANMFFIDIPDKSETNLYAVAGIINSTIFSVFARSIANPQQNGYFKFNKQFIEPIPFPKENFEKNPKLIEEITLLAKEIEQVQSQYLSATPRQKNILRSSLTTFWNDLDGKVYQLYQLSDLEIEFFYQRGRNIHRIQILD
jgi:hypothetical protein